MNVQLGQLWTDLILMLLNDVWQCIFKSMLLFNAISSTIWHEEIAANSKN